jgi:hypothetical protein
VETLHDIIIIVQILAFLDSGDGPLKCVCLKVLIRPGPQLAAGRAERARAAGARAPPRRWRRPPVRAKLEYSA